MKWNLLRRGSTEVVFVVIVVLLLGLLPIMIMPVKGGTLSLTKGSWDCVGLDHNNVLDGPNQYVIQIHITNTAGVTALSVSGTLAWTTANTYINLGPNESFTKTIGDIAPGATVDLFYLVEVTRDSNAYDTTRGYTITISGTNTGTPDTITGQLIVERLRSQARNSVASMVASTTTPSVGDTFTITVHSLTGAKNYAIVNLPVSGYNPLVIEPVSYTCTWVEPPAPPQTSSNVKLDLPGDDDFTSVWTFRAVAPGTSGAVSFIEDSSGGVFHYNADYPDSLTITVRGVADLRLEKTVDDSTPNVGDNVTFTITIYNDGPNDAHNVAVKDLLPVGLSYVSDTPSQGTYDNVSGIWTVGTITNGGSATLQITAKVTISSPIKNVAQVYASDESDPDSTPNNDDGDQSEDDEDFEILTPQHADLSLTKTVNNPTPNVGDTVTFTITVTNGGPDTATNVQVRDVVPNGYTYVPGSMTGGDVRNEAGAPTLVWTINSLAVGSTNLTFQAVVKATGNYKNVAQVTASDQYDPDSVPNNDDGDQSEDDEDFETPTPQRADLSLTKTVDNPTPNVGDTVTFTITVTNGGPNTATNVQITDVVPNGFTYVAGTMTGGDVRNEAGAPTLVWTINSLAVGSTNLTFQAVVQATGNYKNVAQVTASDQYDPDSTPNNDDGDQSEDDEDFEIAAPSQADLRVTKNVSNPNPGVGDTLTFTITVYNDGPNTATNVQITDVVPNGYTYVAGTMTGGDVRNEAGAPTLVWTINSLTSGSNAVLTFQAVVQATGNYKNVAQVTASDQYDPDSTPNNDDGDQSEDDEDFAAATPFQADLRLTKAINDPTPIIGDTVTFTITVYNDGPDTATNIAVADYIPDGYSYVPASIAGGDSRNDSGAPTLTWTINSIANGSNAVLTFQAVVLGTGNCKNVAQVTASDQYDPDSTPNNDDGDQSEDDEDFAAATPEQADLRLTKAINDPTPIVGDTVTFTITVYNDGPDTATNVQIADVIQSGFTYVPASIAGGDSRDDSGAPTLTWTINSIANGSNAVLTFQAVVQATGNYRNVAQVTASDQCDPDSTPNNDDGDQSEDDEDFAAATPGGVPVLHITTLKSASPSIASPGSIVLFTITITNTGGFHLDPVEVIDDLSPGLTYANAANILPDTVTLNPDGSATLTWNNVGPLNPGGSITLSFYAIFNGLESSACNVAAATGTAHDESLVSDEATACVHLPRGATPYEPNVSLQPLAYSRMIDCYNPFKDLIDRIRSSGVEVTWDRQRSCCENLHELVEQLMNMVLEKGLDKEYPEKWARVQELLPFVDECCRKQEDYYNAGNYIASNYWGLWRDEAYREIIEILLEMLGI